VAARAEPAAEHPVSDHYTMLGVRREASPQEIEAAYRRAALERGYQDGAWRELRDAYDVLRDPDQRARYDETGDGALPKEPRKKTHNPLDRLFPNLPHGWRVAIDWVVTIVGAVAIVLAIKAWVVNPYRIPSSSMEPTLHCARPAAGCEASTSDRVLANRFIYHFRDPKRGEIVVFKTPSLAKQECGSEGTFVKRLIGLPGEVWEERSGFVYINGKKLDESYIQPDRRDSQTLGLADLPPRGKYTRIPPDYYLMMGDNRNSSCDSRRWGLVPRKNLIGKVFATYWPPGRISFH
jgi:signal peptidase I